MKALRIMADPAGLTSSEPRHRLDGRGRPAHTRTRAHPDRPHLAISLAAPTDEQRNV
jgi:adenine C2-methylase RlmN of 23S rRNA A2503 and tRNA A37